MFTPIPTAEKCSYLTPCQKEDIDCVRIEFPLADSLIHRDFADHKLMDGFGKISTQHAGRFPHIFAVPPQQIVRVHSHSLCNVSGKGT